MYINDGTGIVERFPDTFLAAFPVAIETQPMLHFYPGGKFLQVCTAGCNFYFGGCVSHGCNKKVICPCRAGPERVSLQKRYRGNVG